MRKAHQQPSTAYDYRRAIFLVQTLATGKIELLEALCEKRGIPMQTFTTAYKPYHYISLETLQQLAIQALDDSREDAKDTG